MQAFSLGRCPTSPAAAVAVHGVCTAPSRQGINCTHLPQLWLLRHCWNGLWRVIYLWQIPHLACVDRLQHGERVPRPQSSHQWSSFLTGQTPLQRSWKGARCIARFENDSVPGWLQIGEHDMGSLACLLSKSGGEASQATCLHLAFSIAAIGHAARLVLS